jgi:hypothetical protein
MRIIKDCLSIPCAWCRKTIDFVKHHYSGYPQLQISGAKPEVLNILGISIEGQQVKSLHSNFIAVTSDLSKDEIYIFLPPPVGEPFKDCIGVIFTCSEECKDYFDLSVMNFVNDKMAKP